MKSLSTERDYSMGVVGEMLEEWKGRDIKKSRRFDVPAM
jgi:hypothetical protein